jgi:hypothetical protein
MTPGVPPSVMAVTAATAWGQAARFPDVTVLAAPGTIEVMHYHASPEVRAAVWDKMFPDQIPAASVVAKTPPDNTFEVEGSELHIVEVGHTDTDKTTVLHVPSIGLVVAGDAVYSGVHQYLMESGNGGFRSGSKRWIQLPRSSHARLSRVIRIRRSTMIP